jgi:hypothetical protein
MKNLTLLPALLLICSTANSSPVSLNCISNASDQDVEDVVIRFDEAASTFELYGKSMWSVRTDKEEGGASIKDALDNCHNTARLRTTALGC